MSRSAHNISVEDLQSISRDLVNNYFVTFNIYSLLVLSLVTVTEFSRKFIHISTETRIELAIGFLPDLLDQLLKDKVIDETIKTKLEKEYTKRSKELPLILENYIYVSAGLKNKSKDHNQHRCLIV